MATASTRNSQTAKSDKQTAKKKKQNQKKKNRSQVAAVAQSQRVSHLEKLAAGLTFFFFTYIYLILVFIFAGARWQS